MRPLASLALLLALLIVAHSAVPFWSVRANQSERSRRVPELSEMLTHSKLVSCTSGQGRPILRRTRLATWNIRAARSAPLSEIAAELDSMDADIIALQEVDMRTRRTGFVDEAATLARTLNFYYAFGATIKWDEGDYGLALLSRWPLTEVRRHRLDVPDATESRIVLETAVCVDGRLLRLFNHHADDRAASRAAGLTRLRTILHSHAGSGIVLLGDFNEPPDAPGIRSLVEAGLSDAGAERDEPSAFESRIDYILVDRPLAQRMSPARVWPTSKSDHYAVLADLER